MSRLQPIAPQMVSSKTQERYRVLHGKLGMLPNMMLTMANAPAVLDGYLQFSNALGKGKLSSKLRDQIALVVGQTNQCAYCLAAHTTVGESLGVNDEQLRDSRLGNAVDPNTEVLLRLARKLIEQRGRIDASDLEAVRAAGHDDSILAEVVAHVALNLFTNSLNLVAETEIDFPAAPELTPTRPPATCALGSACGCE